MKAKGKIIHFKRFILLIVLTTLLIAAFIYSAYTILDRMTLHLVQNYTNELAMHDMATIRMFINDRWTTMNSLYKEFRISKHTTLEEILTDLGNKSTAKEFDHCYFIDDAGNLYSPTGDIFDADDNPLLEYFSCETNPFVERYDYHDLCTENTKEHMLYGMRFEEEPLVVTNNDKTINIVGLAVLNDIAKIRGRLRITCFGERGYASIIDTNGNYIVPEEYSDTLHEYPNFYSILNNRNMDGISIEELQSRIDDRLDTPSFWCNNEDGKRVWVSVFPIENSDWNFIISLEESIFSDQTREFIRILVLVLSVLILVIVLIVSIAGKMRKSLRNMYSSVALNVHNRQYYEDKLKDIHVNALSILDLDHLKTINDSFGHIAGDMAIIRVAESIAKYVGKKGSVCRYGGDEFVIAFTENLSSQEFCIILENIRATVENASFDEYPELRITMSIGGYYGEGKPCDLFRPTDVLLYKSKQIRNFVTTNID